MHLDRNVNSRHYHTFFWGGVLLFNYFTRTKWQNFPVWCYLFCCTKGGQVFVF